MLINHAGRWIYTAIPKTASKTISCAFGQTQHPEPSIYHATVRDITRMYPETLGYSWWGVVRNPFSRLVSCYFDFTMKRGHQYSEHVRHDRPLLSEFTDFQDFCLRLGESHWRNDIFFKPQTEFLRSPDTHNIGIRHYIKYETLEQDFIWLCDTLQIKERPTLTRQNEGLYDKAWRSYYVSNQQVEAVARLYAEDLRNFHYDF